ncbi:MAG: DsbA family protein [Burkholderiaceae bacterium]
MSDLKSPVSSSDHVQGDPSAPLVLVEYGDYQCPYCAEAHGIVRALQDRYGDELCYVFRNFPLTQLHPEALSAAMVAEFAAGQGAFWEVHDALYENQRQLGMPLYAAIVGQFGLSDEQVMQALNDDGAEQKIRLDLESGMRSGAQGTPTFFINGRHYEGDTEWQGLVEALEAQRMPDAER